MEYKNLNDYELFYMIQDADNYEDILGVIINKYSSLVLKIANFYQKYMEYLHYDFDDLFQLGLIAVFEAVKRYDENLGVKFYTFVYACIRMKYYSTFKCLMNKNAHLSLVSLDAYADNNYDDLLFNMAIDDLNPLYNNITDIDVLKIFTNFKNKLPFLASCVFELKINNFTYKEISALLGISCSSVKAQIRIVNSQIKKNYCF